MTTCPPIDFANNVESVTFVEYKDESKIILKELCREKRVMKVMKVKKILMSQDVLDYKR